MTKYEISKLISVIWFSGGSLLLGELATSVLLGVEKTSATVTTGVSSIALPNYLGAGAIQAVIAAYGANRVGNATQIYLEAGCTWGQLGANTVIQEILNRVDDKTIISRLRYDLSPPKIPANPATE